MTAAGFMYLRAGLSLLGMASRHFRYEAVPFLLIRDMDPSEVVLERTLCPTALLTGAAEALPIASFVIHGEAREAA